MEEEEEEKRVMESKNLDVDKSSAGSPRKGRCAVSTKQVCKQSDI